MAAVFEENERRRETRINRTERAQVTVAEPTADIALANTQFDATTVDISACGMQLKMANILSIGTHIEICVSIQGSPMRFFIKGEVRWQADNTAGEHCHGIQLQCHGKPSADLLSWQELFI